MALVLKIDYSELQALCRYHDPESGGERGLSVSYLENLGSVFYNSAATREQLRFVILRDLVCSRVLKRSVSK
jgi:hypothetical protein